MQEITRKQLIKILHSDDFDALIKLYAEVTEKWQSENCIGDTEFQTLKKLFFREGKIQGLREFFDILEQGE
jgi:hypothetical protein